MRVSTWIFIIITALVGGFLGSRFPSDYYLGSGSEDVRNSPIGGKVQGGTSGSILFVDSSGKLAQDNANLFFDNANNRLGAGSSSVATGTTFAIQPSQPNATSTLHLGTGGSTIAGSCIQMYQPNGSKIRMFVNNSATLVTQAGSCDAK